MFGEDAPDASDDLTGVSDFASVQVVERFHARPRFNILASKESNSAPMSQHHLICRCCAGRMTVASATNPNICPGCGQMLEDDSPTHAAALMDTNDARKEELIDRSQNLKAVA